MLKSKEEILALAKRQYIVVDGCRVQSLTDLELVDLRVKWGKEDASFGVVRADLLAASVVDAEGNRIFSEDDIPKICELPAGFVDKIYRACREINNLDDDEEAQIEETAKKFDPAEDSK